VGKGAETYFLCHAARKNQVGFQEDGDWTTAGKKRGGGGSENTPGSGSINWCLLPPWRKIELSVFFKNHGGGK